MKLLKEQKLEEKIPRDLAKKYIRNDTRRKTYSDAIDYDKSTYEQIDPDTAFKMWKDGDYKNLLVLVDTKRGEQELVKFRDQGRVDVNYNFDITKPFMNRNGTAVYDIKRMNIRHLLNVADKIYLKDEVCISPDKINKNRSVPAYKQPTVDAKGNQIIADYSGDDWFIPDTGAHSAMDDRPELNTWANTNTYTAKGELKSINAKITNRQKTINNFKDEKARYRNKSMLDYIIALNSEDKLNQQLTKAKQKLRDQRIYSRDFSQISTLKAGRRQLIDLQKKLKNYDIILNQAEQALDDMTVNRYSSDEYQFNKSKVDRITSKIKDLQSEIDELNKELSTYQSKIDEEGIDAIIKTQTDKVNDIKSWVDDTKNSIKNLTGRKTN